MNETLYVVVDRSRVRVYRHAAAVPPATRAGPKLVESIDCPEGRAAYFDRESDAAGRFPSSRGPGMSTDERLPMKEEHERRIAADIVSLLNRILPAYPEATWHLAAGPGLLQTVLAQLAPDHRQRLGKTLAKNLAQLPVGELTAHFA